MHAEHGLTVPSVLDKLRVDARVSSVDDERGLGDGVWVYLKDGYVNDSTECAMVHEETPTACLRVLRAETRRTDAAE